MAKVFLIKRQRNHMNQNICLKNHRRLEADYGQS